MFGLNIYAMIAAGVAVAAIGGSLAYQNHEIHSWHVKYDQQNTTDAKKIGDLTAHIEDMTTTQNTQTATTQEAVTKVITIPGATQVIVKHIHDAPEPANCGTPPLTEEDKNAI